LAGKTTSQQKDRWLRLLYSGDKDAFARFVNEYQQLVFLCCKTLGLSETEAEDVAIDSFLAAYQQLKNFRGRSRLSTWLWRIAYYKAVDYIRKNRLGLRRLDELDKQLADRKTLQAQAELENKEQSQLVWEAVRTLPGHWSIAILLFYRENKSIQEISKIMKKSQNTVKTYLFRGRKRLKDILADYIGDDKNGLR
jgi:RNA polymerase sigma-70 factor (ECF subfamily)